MKKTVFMVCLAVLAMFVVSSAGGAHAAGIHDKYQKDLTTDDQLKEANVIYKKAVGFLKRADGAFYKRPGEAVAYYMKGESYLNNTVFKLKELGQEHSVDVSKEIALCEDLARNAHVKSGRVDKDKS